MSIYNRYEKELYLQECPNCGHNMALLKRDRDRNTMLFSTTEGILIWQIVPTDGEVMRVGNHDIPCAMCGTEMLDMRSEPIIKREIAL
jgi:predicted RNA-binding Zn-ribbon protein involved in translation (DUF1610 family)